ncbi:MAG: peptidase M23 [Pseudomonadota bacterium]
MIRAAAFSLLFLLAATPLTSGDISTQPSEATVTHQARLAAEKLIEAGEMLLDAQSAENRVRALTETIRAYEIGIAVLRTGLQQAELREAVLQDRLHAREGDISHLLGALMVLEHAGVPSFLAHPAGALGTARSGMILADVTPALQSEAATLRTELQELQDLTALQRDAAISLSTGLEGAETARAALSAAISNRTDLPRRFIEDPVKTALLIASSETMADFAGSLDVVASSIVPGSLPDIADRRGQLSLPVADGKIDHDFDVSSHPALQLVTTDNALVTTPVPASLRYSGPLLDYGNVVILEPQSGILIVMAGLETVFGEVGQVLPGGSPVGWMPGSDGDGKPETDAHLSATDPRAGSQATQTLYIEVRENNIPVDPLTWFAVTEG